MDLSKFLFHFGIPVSTFDIAILVQGALKERQRHRPMQASIIDKLIEEALLEFTSLTDDKAAPGGGHSPIDTSTITGPLKPPAVTGSYVDVGSWIDDIAVVQKPADEASRASALPRDLAVGNLAALEDDEPEPRSSHPGTEAAAKPPIQPMSSSAPPPAQSSAPEKKAGSKLGVVVAVAVVMAAGAAAWFTHLIPHP
jgi:hypothetical protein